LPVRIDQLAGQANAPVAVAMADAMEVGSWLPLHVL
jgi:hypothetical protein